MKLTCTQSDLSRGLGIVGRVVATKPLLPILSNVLLSAEDTRLRLTTTNLDLGVTCWIDATVVVEGTIAIPARQLVEFVNSLPSERVELSTSAQTMTVRCGRGETRIKGMDPDDFPPVPTAIDQPTTRIEAGILHEAISLVAFAAATDDTRPTLAGVFCHLDGNQMILATADGFRLAVHTVPLLSAAVDQGDVIIPRKVLTDLNRILAGEKEPVEITVTPTKSHVLFRVGNVDMVSTLIPGTFPNYRQLIPQGFVSRTVLNRTDLLRAVKTAAIFAKDSKRVVRLQAEPDHEMIVSAHTDEQGNAAAEVLCRLEGPAVRIAFDSKYLVELLSTLKCAEVALQTSSPSSPAAILPVGTDAYVHVLMPMNVEDSTFPTAERKTAEEATP